MYSTKRAKPKNKEENKMTYLKLKGNKTIPCKEYPNGLISAGVKSKTIAREICECNNVAIVQIDIYTDEIYFSELL